MCPYPQKVQTCPPQDQRLATHSRVSGRECSLYLNVLMSYYSIVGCWSGLCLQDYKAGCDPWFIETEMKSEPQNVGGEREKEKKTMPRKDIFLDFVRNGFVFFSFKFSTELDKELSSTGVTISSSVTRRRLIEVARVARRPMIK